MEMAIKPIIRDGREYYVAFCSPIGALHIRREAAALGAAELFAGRDWRRIKREMNRARKNVIGQYGLESGRL